jgi:hypothetical protein
MISGSGDIGFTVIIEGGFNSGTHLHLAGIFTNNARVLYFFRRF